MKTLYTKAVIFVQRYKIILTFPLDIETDKMHLSNKNFLAKRAPFFGNIKWQKLLKDPNGKEKHLITTY